MYKYKYTKLFQEIENGKPIPERGMVIGYEKDILILAFYNTESTLQRRDSEAPEKQELDHSVNGEGEQEKPPADDAWKQNAQSLGEAVERTVSGLAESNPTYLESQKDRDDEQGMKRIGVPIKLQEDMFTMLFVSTLWSEYIYVLQKDDRIRKEK